MLQDDEFLSRATELFRVMKTIKPSEYWESPLPCPPDDSVALVCDLYLEATELQREVLISDLSEELSAILGFFATRMAMLSVRQHSSLALWHGLVARVIQLDWSWTDPRDAVIPGLVLIYHSAMKLGIDPDALFATAAEVAIRRLTKDIVYPPRVHATEDSLLEAIWWDETDGPAGLVYHRKGRPIPAGHLAFRQS